MNYAKPAAKTIAPAFKMLGVSDESHVCECCGKKNLKRVVTLENLETGAIVRYGTDCAAKAMKTKSAIVKSQMDAVAVAQKWLARGFTPEVVKMGIWDRFGYQTAIKNGKLLIGSIGEITL